MISGIANGTILPLCLLRSGWNNVALTFLNALSAFNAPSSIFLSKLVPERPLSFLRNWSVFSYEMRIWPLTEFPLCLICQET